MDYNRCSEGLGFYSSFMNFPVMFLSRMAPTFLPGFTNGIIRHFGVKKGTGTREN
jgi:hypothetical protein